MEQALFLVVIVASALIGILMRWARQHAEAPPLEAKPRRPTEPPELRRVRTPTPPPELPVPSARRPLPPTQALVSRRRRPVHQRLGRHTDVRRAIVM
ncbi:MAG: hypothetical protein ACREK4_18695, partial [Candidatus Rokuibacteriota bacterium]